MKTCKKFGHVYEDKYKACPECKKIRNRLWEQNNPEKFKAYQTAYHRAWYHHEDNKEKRRSNQREWARRNPEATRNNQLKRNYGITLEDYNKMFEAQNGICKICCKHQDVLPKSLCVDHCHETKKIRGLLCDDCNRALGLFKDNIEVLNVAINYLKAGD